VPSIKDKGELFDPAARKSNPIREGGGNGEGKGGKRQKQLWKQRSKELYPAKGIGGSLQEGKKERRGEKRAWGRGGVRVGMMYLGREELKRKKVPQSPTEATRTESRKPRGGKTD